MKKIIIFNGAVLLVCIYMFLNAKHLKNTFEKEKVEFEKIRQELAEEKEYKKVKFKEINTYTASVLMYGNDSAYAKLGGWPPLLEEETFLYYSFIMALNFDDYTGYSDLHNILEKYLDSQSENDRTISKNFKHFLSYLFAKNIEQGFDANNYPKKNLEEMNIIDKNGKLRHSNYFLEQMKVKED